MNDYKSVQDLIVKAALYDGVSTTIAPHMDNIPAVKITFSKGDKHSATLIDLGGIFGDPESMALRSCKDALYKLLWERYDEIKIKEK